MTKELPSMKLATTLSMLLLLSLLGGCASRPVNPPITQADPRSGYRFETRKAQSRNAGENLVILAFSGGGTRAAAFSYGVLEFLRRTEIAAPNGARFRLLDSVDVITGVSGGSFTALAYGLYGDKLFDDYEQPNYAYTSYYQEMAHVHFGLRRLSETTGKSRADLVEGLRGAVKAL
jgi:NTE family protein